MAGIDDEWWGENVLSYPLLTWAVARKSERSDVRVTSHEKTFAGVGRVITCEDCPLMRYWPNGKSRAWRVGAAPMRAHLYEHQRYGHRVPEVAFRRLDILERQEQGR